MGEKEEFIKELKERIRKSDELFLVATKLLKDGFLEDAASRAYYSLFHLLTAYLLLEGGMTKTHKGLLNRIGLKIKDGLMSPKIGKVLRILFQYRETADYGIFTFFTNEEISNIFKELEEIRTEIKEKHLKIEELQ